MSFKEISNLELAWPLSLAKQNHLGNFSRGYHEEHFYEIILIWTIGSVGEVVKR